MTFTAAAMAILAALFIVAGLFLLLCCLEWWAEDRGYRAGSRPVQTYRRPPSGKAPGA